MASNKLYGLPDRIELKTMRDPTKEKTENIDDHGQEIYMNTMALAAGTAPSVEDKDHDYEILHQKFSPPKRNMPAQKNLKQCVIGKEYRCVFIVFGGMMCVLFFMVTGLAVALGVLHKTGELQHSWEPWAQWSPCSASCDFGISLRKRNCSNGDSKMGFTDCVGDASEYQLCKESPCNETNRQWSAWEQWSSCSAPCNVGMRHRRRDCNETSSSENAMYCIGDATEYQLCNERACSGLVVDGGWSGWLAWGSCSTTCGTGFQLRQRTCSSPKPRNGGEHCFGEGADYRTCKLRICSVSDGYWSSWSSWSSCSSTCTKTRTRYCTTYTGGRQCLGNSLDQQNCNLTGCALTQLRIRLIGSYNRGRLEVSLDGIHWGTVCNNYFDNLDARVVCRMLGYTGYSILAASSISYGSGPIYLDNLSCDGTESSLLHCNHNGWGKHNCNHGKDVGVYCY